MLVACDSVLVSVMLLDPQPSWSKGCNTLTTSLLLSKGCSTLTTSLLLSLSLFLIYFMFITSAYRCVFHIEHLPLPPLVLSVSLTLLPLS